MFLSERDFQRIGEISRQMFCAGELEIVHKLHYRFEIGEGAFREIVVPRQLSGRLLAMR